MRFALVALLLFASDFSIARSTLELEAVGPAICALEAGSKRADAWLPTLQETEGLEKSLVRFLDRRSRSGKPMPVTGIVYARQYEGVVRNGRRFIRGLYFPAEMTSAPSFKKYGCVSISDGGNSVWQVEFEVGRRVFWNFSVNGEA